MITMYGAHLFHTDSFQAQPVGTLWRSAVWMTCHIIPRRHAIISLTVGTETFRLDLPPLLKRFGSTGIFVQRSYYEPLLRFCDRLVRAGDVVMDCGANQGIYTCAFAAVAGPGGKVTACEPQSYAVGALRGNLRLNAFDSVAIEQVAVSDRDGFADLDVSSGPTTASIVHDYGKTDMLRVRTATLETLTAGFDRLDLIKMDIEGAEYDALVGGAGVIDRFRPTVVMEGGKGDMHWEDLSRFFARRGYRPHLFDQGGDLLPLTDVGDSHPCIVFLPQTPS